jgi:hypothetical protein
MGSKHVQLIKEKENFKISILGRKGSDRKGKPVILM